MTTNTPINKRRNKPSSGKAKFRGVSQKQRPSNNRNHTKKNGRESKLDPSLLVKKAIPLHLENYVSDRCFDDMPIDNRLKACIKKKGFEKPTEIQDRTLESLLKGRDLLGIAKTGTGKTGAFLIPIINQLIKNNQKNYALVVVPTRELATQIEQEFRSMTKDLGLYSATFIGGTNINRDLQALRRQSHIVIATPGRLLDLVSRSSAMHLGNYNTLVLDEFDRMLDMGFVRDVTRIIDGMKRRKHTMLFSATMDKTQQGMINDILHQHETVKVSTGETTADHIDQEVIKLKSGEDKFDVLCKMIEQDHFQKVLVFDETKHRVNRLCIKLNKAGIKSDQIHGNKSQNARQKALSSFKQGKVQVLVATDVAARGIDISDVTHVINYQLPQTYDSYIHRIGRTGRAGKKGKAYTFVA